MGVAIVSVCVVTIFIAAAVSIYSEYTANTRTQEGNIVVAPIQTEKQVTAITNEAIFTETKYSDTERKINGISAPVLDNMTLMPQEVTATMSLDTTEQAAPILQAYKAPVSSETTANMVASAVVDMADPANANVNEVEEATDTNSKPAKNLDELVSLASDQNDVNSRLSAISAIAMHQSREAVNVLIMVSYDQDPKVRYQAIQQLWNLAMEGHDIDGSVPSILQLAISDSDPRIISFAKMALEEIRINRDQ